MTARLLRAVHTITRRRSSLGLLAAAPPLPRSPAPSLRPSRPSLLQRLRRTGTGAHRPPQRLCHWEQGRVKVE